MPGTPALWVCMLGMMALAAGAFGEPQVQKWPLAKAVEIPNSSPWARHETFTRVISGVGSGNALEFRVQLFNAFNDTNFPKPDTTFGTSVFGNIFGAGRAREIEIALNYSF